MEKMCQHCGKAKVTRPRGLCWSHYYTPGIRDLYEPTACASNRRGDGFHESNAAVMPTPAPPGSKAKMVAMRRRLMAGASLHHPDDAGDVVLELLNPFGDVRWQETGDTGLEGSA